MTNKKEYLSYVFEIEESDEGRFLVDKKSQKKIVELGNEKIEYLKLNNPTIYYNFKVIGDEGVGLMQLRYGGRIAHYTDITGVKKSNQQIFKIDEVLTVPAKFKEVSINHISEKFGIKFPIAYKANGEAVVFYNGEELTKTLGYRVIVCMRENKALYIPQIITYRKGNEYVISQDDEIIFATNYSKYPKLDFIKNADFISSIVPSYAEYKTDIWMYCAKQKVGIVYIDSEGMIKDYHISDIDFSKKDNVYYINENYIIYHVNNEKRLYFKGKKIGNILSFDSESKQQYFLRTSEGFYIGKSFFKAKDFCNSDYLELRFCHKLDNVKIKICLNAGTYFYNFLLDLSTGIAVKM